MKKALLFSFLFASSSVLAHQNTITLPGGIVGSNQKIVISANQLTEKTHYAIKCSVNTAAPTNSPMLGFHIIAKRGVHAATPTLNGQEFDSESATLNSLSDNIVAITDFASFGKGNAFVFSNSSPEYAYTVNYCEATVLADTDNSGKKEEEKDAKKDENKDSSDKNKDESKDKTDVNKDESKDNSDVNKDESKDNTDANKDETKDNTDVSKDETKDNTDVSKDETKDNTDATTDESNNNSDSTTDTTDTTSNDTTTDTTESTVG